MKNLKKTIRFIVYLLLTAPVISIAQTPANPSIDEQFRILSEKSNNYQDYKVIRKTELQKLWKNASDSIKAKQNAYSKISGSLKAKDNTINQLKVDLSKKNEELLAAINSNNEISFLGFIPLSKGAYNTLMCGIIAVLIASCAFFYLRSKYANKQAKEKATLYNEVSEEYKSFKTRAHENEKKLARALQDERNKLAEHNIL